MTIKRPYPRTVVLLISTLVAAAVIVLDRMTKIWAMALPSSDHELIPRFLALTHHQNVGLIADLPVPSFIIIGITSLVLLVVGLFCFRAIHRQILIESVAFACIAGGAIGNLWDRLTFGYVFDWLMFFHWSIMNVADIAIGFGILILLLDNSQKNWQRYR